MNSRIRGAGGDQVPPKRRFVVALYLAAETKDEAALGEVLQVPGFHGEHHRAARECDRHGCLQADGFGRGRGDRHRHDGVVRQFAAGDAVEAVRLGAPRLLRKSRSASRRRL